MNISSHIENQIEAFKRPYKRNDGDMYDRYGVIHRINAYNHNKYVECTDESAIFWNICTPQIPHFKKNILLHIKDFYPEGRGDYNQFQSWVTKVRFRKWARDTELVDDLDELAEGLTTSGEHIWKVNSAKGEKDIMSCDLSRFYFDRTVGIDNSDKIEVHELTEAQIRAKEGAWDYIDEIIENAEKVNEDDKGMIKYKIYEFTGWVKETDDAKLEHIHAFVAGKGDKEIIAFKEPGDKSNTKYYHFKLNKDLNGIFERLFDLQELANKRVNQNDEAQTIASLLLLRTNDPNTSGNILRSAMSGDIINSIDLEQIPIDNRALSAFLNEMAFIEQQASKLCMTPEVITGEDTPSGTPFRSLATLANRAMKAFKSIRNRIGAQVSAILVDDIFPSVVKGWEDQFMEIADDDNDIREFERRALKFRLNEWIKQQKEETGGYPSQAQIEDEKQNIIQDFEENGRRIKIEKGFFNWDFGFIYNSTNEVEDRAQQNDVMNNLLQYKMSNPAIANDPLFRQLAEKNGISAVKLSQEELQQLAPQMQPTGQSAGLPKITPKQDKLLAQVDSN